MYLIVCIMIQGYREVSFEYEVVSRENLDPGKLVSKSDFFISKY